VAKLADAGGLNPPSIHVEYGFKSRPGHHTLVLFNLNELSLQAKRRKVHKRCTELCYSRPMARGSIFKKDDRWAFRVDAGISPETGKRRQMLRQGFKTKREAETALAAAQQSVEQGSVVSKSSMKVDAFLDEWLASQQGRLKASTHHSYVVTSKRIRSGLGHVQVQALTPLQIETFYSELLDHGRANGTGLSPKTVRNTHTVLRKALSDAERLGIVYRNAAAAARGPSVERPEFMVWSSDELRQFFAAAESNHIYGAFVLLATTGMRRGEVLGVRWKDIDLDSGELAIVQTITNVDGKLTVGSPKTTKSRRVIYLDDTTVTMLRQQRRRPGLHRRGRPAGSAGAVLEGVRSSGRSFGRPSHPSARCPPHLRDAGLEGRRASEGRVGAPWPFDDRHHPRPVLTRHARHGPGCSRSRCSKDLR
jgi:integrase